MRKRGSDMPKVIGKYYRHWLSGHPLSRTLQDERRFYKFVKACLRYSRKTRTGSWLRKNLEKDLPKQYVDTGHVKDQIGDVVDQYESLLEYDKADVPDALVENRNPKAVRAALKKLHKRDGSPAFSKEQIDREITRRFGEKD